MREREGLGIAPREGVLVLRQELFDRRTRHGNLRRGGLYARETAAASLQLLHRAGIDCSA
jgi:hypothetical protein